MTPDKFRKLALALPETSESSHMNHPDFRVKGKIFATLGYPDETFAMVKLNLEQQARFVASSPKAFQPVPGGWGLKGATRVHLKSVKVADLRTALLHAWRNNAPKSLHDLLEDPD